MKHQDTFKRELVKTYGQTETAHVTTATELITLSEDQVKLNMLVHN